LLVKTSNKKNSNKFFIAVFAFLKYCFCFPLSDALIKITPLNEDGECPRIQWNNLASGDLFSPNFPQNYPNNANCTYMLTCPIGTKVTVIFELINLDFCCDHISLYEGPGINSTNQIAQITESSNIYKYSTINSNIMTVQFLSDENLVSQGFYAVFGTSDDAITQCSSNNFSNLFGVIVSPDYPLEYPPNSNCSYLIGNGEPNTIVLLTINYFVTEKCCDELKIFDGINSSANLTESFLGDIAAGTKIYSTGPYMFLLFTSDSNTQFQGYSIIYEIIDAQTLDSFTFPNRP
jgi:hypothetical protein